MKDTCQLESVRPVQERLFLIDDRQGKVTRWSDWSEVAWRSGAMPLYWMMPIGVGTFLVRGSDRTRELPIRLVACRKVEEGDSVSLNRSK